MKLLVINGPNINFPWNKRKGYLMEQTIMKH